MKKCSLCNKKLDGSDVVVCASCLPFVEWKYGSLEDFEKFRKEGVYLK